MHVLLLEPPVGSAESPHGAIRRMLEQRLHLFPSLQRRLIHSPLQIADPHWIEDPDFDLDAHLRLRTLPAPGSMRELEAFVGEYAGRLVALLGQLFDHAPEAVAIPPPEQEWQPGKVPGLSWLPACCASLRSWLMRHGGLPERPLVVTVPVAVRSADDDEAGNRASRIRAHLPMHIDDPVERLQTIHAEIGRRKQDHARGGGGDAFKHFTDIVTNVYVPWLLTHLMALYSSSHLADRMPPLWNLVISNVPGPEGALYFAGAKLLRVYPLGPAQQGSGINITVMSTGDSLCLGAMACAELVPDVEDIASGFVREIELLRSAC